MTVPGEPRRYAAPTSYLLPATCCASLTASLAPASSLGEPAHVTAIDQSSPFAMLRVRRSCDDPVTTVRHVPVADPVPRLVSLGVGVPLQWVRPSVIGP